jgi:hypothetical protein
MIILIIVYSFALGSQNGQRSSLLSTTYSRALEYISKRAESQTDDEQYSVFSE